MKRIRAISIHPRRRREKGLRPNRSRSRVLAFACCALGASILAGSMLAGGSVADSAPEEQQSTQQEPSPALLKALEAPPSIDSVAQRDSESKPPSLEGESERLESSQAFRELNAAEAAKVAAQVFPNILKSPDYGPPELAQGERITGYPEPNVAQLAIQGDEHAVIESAQPMVTSDPSGKEVPVDLGLREQGGTIEPVTPLVPLEMPLKLMQGISLPSSGLTLTPVNAQGAGLGGAEGMIEGAAAFYANTQPDTDTVVKPTPTGFETQSILRSPVSPATLYFNISARESAVLLNQAKDGSVAVESNGRTIATVAPVTAVDGAGTPVPVTQEVNGGELSITVMQSSTPYQYPIVVDPTVAEKNWGYFEQGPWYFTTNSAYNFVEPYYAGHPEFPTIYTERPYGYGIYGAWNYTTQGSSRIYSFEPTVWSTISGDQMTNIVGFVGAGGWEPEPHYLGTYIYPGLTTTQCPAAGCPSTGGTAGNTAVWEKIAINSGTFTSGTFQNLDVRIAQDTGPSVTFDTADKEIEGQLNPLYGSGVWLTSGKGGRLKATGTDPGIGIYKRSLLSTNYSSWSSKLTFGSAAGCVGVQCKETYSMPANVANLPEGINTIEAKVENATGAIGTKTAQVKIDNTAPYASVSSGLPNNLTVSRGSIHKLEFTIGDGTAPKASSGVAAGKSEVLIDGVQVLGKAGAPGCSEGPCTTTRSYTLNTRGESSGLHIIKIIAEDGVGNSSETEVPFVVKSGPGTAMGPGTLDLASGEYSLSSTDVSAATAGKGLAVMRAYKSQSLPVSGSPFGTSWQMSLGGWQGVDRLSEGTAIFTDARGRSVLFQSAKGGGYTDPPGYQGWKLSYDEGYLSAFGAKGTANGQFEHPSDVAVDASGNLWVVDKGNSRIEEFNEKGEWLKTIGSLGTTGGKFTSPTGIVIESKGNIWVTDTGNTRVEEFNSKGEFVQTFGREVNKTKVEAKGTEAEKNICTAASGNTCQAGVAGGAEGQMKEPTGIGASSGGNLYVVETGNNRFEKFTPNGERLNTIESAEGSALKEPTAIAVDSTGNLWVADTGNNRIREWSSTFTFLRNVGKEGTGNGEFKRPAAIEAGSKGTVWVSDSGNNRLQEFNEKGEFIAQAGSSGTGDGQFAGPSGVAIDSKGAFLISDSNNNRIEKWISPDVHTYKLTDPQGDVTTFKRPAGVGEEFLPSSSMGPNGTGATSFTFETVEGITRPTQVLGPIPAGVSCATLVRGCRALTFSYASSTSATGTEPSQWGNYKGRLASVFLTAWNPESSSMQTIPVESYSYDSLGRLRAAWDPRVSPALKTLYGYDAAGRVTDLTPPGQQTWGMNYGTVEGDSHADWLLSVSRTQAATPLGSGEAPKNTAVPTFSNNYPVVGTTLSAWNGTWSNSPVGYSYQWSDCNSLGVECTAISGATSQTYKPVSGDLGHRLVVSVTATNSGGAATAMSAATSGVTSTVSMIYSSQFGSAGTGNGQFSHPADTAVDSKGNIWVVDKGNNRLEEFNEKGEFLAKYASAGSGNGQLSSPGAIAIDSSDNVWIADTGNNRIEKFNSSGEYLLKTGTYGTGNGQFSGPEGIAVDSKGNVWVSDTYNGRVQKFNSSGEFLKLVGSYGSEAGQLGEPTGIDVSSSGNAYIADWQNQRITEFNESGGYIRQFGTAGTGNGQFAHPDGLDVDSSNNVWVADEGNGRVQEFSSTGAYLGQFGSKGTGAGQFTFGYPVGLEKDTKGNIWVADTNNNRIEKWRQETTQNNPPPPDPTTAVWTAIYHLPISGTGAPANLSSTEVAKWGQSDLPNEATAIFPPDQVPSRPPVNFKRATVYYMDNSGDTVNTLNPGGRITTNEYDGNENVIRTLSAGNRATALEAGAGSSAKSKTLDTQFTYSEDGTTLLSVLGPQHKVKLPSGKEPEARLHTQYTYDQGAPEGGPYDLVTTEKEGAQISGEPEADIRTKTYSYSGQSNLGWTLRAPTATTVDPGGLNLVSTTLYDPLTGNVTETRKPGHPEGGDAHSARTIYYSAGAAEPAKCGEHPEWANLPCETVPAAQPGTPGLPEIPVTSFEYNIWNEPTTTNETSGSSTRTAKVTYDGGGRPTVSEVSSSTGTPLPAITTTYSSTTGSPVTVSDTSLKGFEAVTSEYNSLGQLTSYTDAGGNVSTYAYDIDGRLTEVNDGKGTQTGTYDSTTGELTSLKDSAVGTFTATYDAQGHMTTEKYPNGMTANYTYDSTGAPTKLTDVKTTHCTESCTWYSDEVTPSIHGQWLKQISTRATQGYTYDADGRLTQAQETPVGEGCTTTLYGYDADTNRTSTVTRAPKEGGACAESGGSTVTNSFDSADRLTDPGVSYDAFGDITELPAEDAGGHSLSSTFYADGSLASQTQNGQTIAYALDPLGRDREVTGSGATTSLSVSHFASDGETPSWTIDESGNWTRYVSGIGGTLRAIQQGASEPQLQIADLHGDIVASAPLSETATGLSWKTETTATGVPRGGKPAKYGWLGFAQRPTELESGVVNLGSNSYVPQVGRYLQPTVVNDDSSAYTYSSGDPVNEAELNGQYSPSAPAWLEQFEASPPGMPPPPPPPAVEGSEEEELLFSEVDPVDSGDYGHLHVNYEAACGEVSCDVDFTFWGVITGRGNRTSGMHLWVTVWNQAFDQETGVVLDDYGIISGLVSHKHPVHVNDLSEGTFYIFNMYVRVGRHTETLRIAFTVVNGEISW